MSFILKTAYIVKHLHCREECFHIIQQILPSGKKKKSHSTRMDSHKPGHSGNTLESPGELSKTFQHTPIKGELLGPSPGPERHREPRLRYSERWLVIYPSLPLSYFIFQAIPPSGLSESFFEGNFVFFVLQSFPPNLDNSDHVTLQMKDLRLCLL